MAKKKKCFLIIALALMLMAMPVFAEMGDWIFVPQSGSSSYFQVTNAAAVRTTGSLTVDGVTTLTGLITATAGLTTDEPIYSTTNSGNYVDLYDASGNVMWGLSTSKNFIITHTSAASLFSLSTGNLKVGQGTPTITQDGADAYVTGTSEVDGVFYPDGGVSTNASFAAVSSSSNALDLYDTSGNVALTTGGTNDITMTLGAATDIVNILTGCFKVGNGSPVQTLSAEDGYVEGTLENAGGFYPYGGVNSDAAFAAISSAANLIDLYDASFNVAIASGGTNDITLTPGTATDLVNVLTGCFKVGNGSPVQTLSAEDAYVEGTLENAGGFYPYGGVNSDAAFAAISSSANLVDLYDASFNVAIASGGTNDITLTPGTATDLVNILTGCLKVGDGSPTQTLNAEDAYVEGTLENAGGFYPYGGMNSDAAFSSISSSSNAIDLYDGSLNVAITSGGTNDITLTPGTATDLVNVLTGCFKVGNGTPAQTLNAEDAYVEGTFENLGGAYLYGGIVSDSAWTASSNAVNALDLYDGSANVAFTTSTGNDITMTIAATDIVNVLTGCFKVGNGTPVQALNAEDTYLEGTVEVAGIFYPYGGVVSDAAWISTSSPVNSIDIYDASADIVFAASTNNSIYANFDSTGEGLHITTGNVYIGDGTPGSTPDGEDLYVNGFVEIDGELIADGGISTDGLIASDTIAGNYIDLLDASSDVAFGASTNNSFQFTLTTATEGLYVKTGNLFVGAGVPTVTPDGEDAYVSGFLEVDGIAYADGGIQFYTTTTDPNGTVSGTAGTFWLYSNANTLYPKFCAGGTTWWTATAWAIAP